MLVACSGHQLKSSPSRGAPSSLPSSSPALSGSSMPPRPLLPLVPQGSTLALSETGDALFVADEDHKQIERLPLPLDQEVASQVRLLPGRPAQLVVLPRTHRVLVTIRDPGMLLVLKPSPGNQADLTEEGRVPLPADAWGVAVDEDEHAAVVTSAWTHQVSWVDLDKLAVVASVSVPREPRGVVILPHEKDGGTPTAYVSHLVGAPLTKVRLEGASLKVQRIALPPSPMRTPAGETATASLGYSLVLSPEEDRLFAPRQALGVLGAQAWAGATTVDVLSLHDDKPLAPVPLGSASRVAIAAGANTNNSDELLDPTQFSGSPLLFPQPRAAVFRRGAKSLLIASEGANDVVELDTLTRDPSLHWLTTYVLPSSHPEKDVTLRCLAPSGLALSPKEETLFIHCRATDLVVQVRLERTLLRDVSPEALESPKKTLPAVSATASASASALASLQPLWKRNDPLWAALVRYDPKSNFQQGRQLYYSGDIFEVSGGLGCAGCHPDGRDDGFTWHEATFTTPTSNLATNFVSTPEVIPTALGGQPSQQVVPGYARRTPMLAGRVDATGPFGWHGESADLLARLKEGFGLHRWGGLSLNEKVFASYGPPLVEFVLHGLVPPPREPHTLTPAESHGRELFLSDKTNCGSCHTPDSRYTNHQALPLPALSALPSFDPEPNQAFKTPSLLFLEGHAPYFHDGSASSIEALVTENHTRMGNTDALTPEERADLIAFLKTL